MASSAATLSTIPDQKEYTIYIPQGATARISKNSSARLITGLYTDQFTTCNILIWIGEDKISLSHLDQAISQTALAELLEDNRRWIGEEKYNVIIISRSEGIKLRERISNMLQELKPELKEVGDDICGVLIDSKKKISLLDQNTKPQNLLHHPDEQKLTACTKINFFVSTMLVDDELTGNTVIYNNQKTWEQIDHALQPLFAKINPELNKEFFKRLKDFGYEMIVEDIISSIAETEEDRERIHQNKVCMEIMRDIAFYVETHAGEYNQDAIFIKNITLLLSEEAPAEHEPTDQNSECRAELLSALSTEPTVAKIKEIVENYRATLLPADTENLLKRIDGFFKHYLRRFEYTQHNKISPGTALQQSDFKKHGPMFTATAATNAKTTNKKNEARSAAPVAKK